MRYSDPRLFFDGEKCRLCGGNLIRETALFSKATMTTKDGEEKLLQETGAFREAFHLVEQHRVLPSGYFWDGKYLVANKMRVVR